MSSPPGAPPPPNVAEIPLPPGMTLDQFQSLQHSLVTLAITAAVAFGVMLWEYANLLPDEIKLYQTSSKDLWHTPASYSFVVLRYSGIIATFPSLFFTSIQSNHCQVAVVISQLGVVLVVASSGIIFCYRVFAIWSGNRLVHAIISIVYLGMLACWVLVASHYHASNGPHTPFGSNCQLQPIVKWAPICNASSVLFDLVILLLTVSKLGANRRSSRVGWLIYRDSVVYFLFTAVTNTAVLVIQALGPRFALVKPAVLPFSTVITATMGVRVFLNLRLLHGREARHKAGGGGGVGSYEVSTGSRSVERAYPGAAGGGGGGGGGGGSKTGSQSASRLAIPMQTLVVSSEGTPGYGAPDGPFYYPGGRAGDVKDAGYP